MIEMKKVLEGNPVIAAVKDMKSLEEAIETDIDIIADAINEIKNIEE